LTPIAAAERARILLESVSAVISTVMGAAAGDVEPKRPLSELGLDSLMAIELRNQLARMSGLRLPASLLFDHPTPVALASLLNQKLFGAANPQASSVDALIGAAIRAIPIARLREAGLLDVLLQLTDSDGSTASSDSVELDRIDSMSVDELVRLVRDAGVREEEHAV
jgi:acyl carrier protein